MNKTILITGASSGIGKATAKHFNEKGWKVIASMRSPEKEQELNQLDNVLVSKLDVTDLDSITKTIKNGIEKFEKIDVLLNNAGYGAYGPLEAFPRENIIKQFNTNVIGLLDVTKAILPHLRQNKSGRIINISSIGGKMTFPLGSLYHGTKFAVEGISESLSFELEGLGIQVKIIEPGMIATDFSGRSFDFQHQPELTDYQSIVDGLVKSMATSSTQFSPPALVAQVIYKAATDDTNQMRYRAGADAEQILDTRKQLHDDDFIQYIKNLNFNVDL